MEPKQGNFEGWASVEIMGHQRHIGFVTTESFGGPVLMRVDTPELPEREYVLDKPAYVDVTGDGGEQWTPVGAKVKRPATPGSTVYVGVGSIYRLIPCTEAAALKAIEAAQSRTPILLELPPERTLTAASDADPDDDGEEEEDRHF